MQNRFPARNVDPKRVERFRYSPQETLFIGVLRSLQIVCVLGSAAAFVDHLVLPGWGEAFLIPFLVFPAHLISYYRGIWLEQNFQPNHLFVMLIEFLALFVVMRLAAILFGFTQSFIDLYFMLDYFWVASAWQMGRTWSRYYHYLHVQPYELPPEEGGGSSTFDGNRITYDHLQAYEEMKGAWYWMAGFQIIIVILGVALAIQYADTFARAGLPPILIACGAIHLLLGIPLVAWLRLRYLRTTWQLGRLKEPPGLTRRWRFYLLVLCGLAFIPAILLALAGSVISLPTSNIDISKIPPFNIYAPPDGSPTPITPSPPRPPRDGPPWVFPEWLSMLIVILALAFLGFLFWIIFRQLRPQLGIPKPIKFRSNWRAFLQWLRSLFARTEPGEPFERDYEREERRRRGFWGRLRREPLPPDPRGQVRYHYKQMAQRASRAGLPRQTGQTPEEYAGELAPALENPQLKPTLNGLTDLYDEARYSPHPIEEAQAAEARQQSEQLRAQFRRKTRRERAEAQAEAKQARQEKAKTRKDKPKDLEGPFDNPDYS